MFLGEGLRKPCPLSRGRSEEYRVEEVRVDAYKLRNQYPGSFLLSLGLLNQAICHRAVGLRLLPERLVPGLKEALEELHVTLLKRDSVVGDSLVGLSDCLGHLFSALIRVLYSVSAHY